MKIGIDLDGVICSFTQGVIRVANELWPGKLPEGFQPPDWNYTGYLTKDDWKQLWDRIKSTRDFWVSLPPYQENVEALKHFLTDNRDQEIFYITSRAEVKGLPISAQTQLWFNLHQIWHHGNTHAILPVREGAPGKSKAAVLEGLGIKYYLDDYLPTIEEVSKIDGLNAYILNRPWNLENRTYDGYEAVDSVRDYFERIHTT